MSPPLPLALPRRVSRRAARAAGALLLAAGAVLLNLWFWGATVRDEPVLIALREVPAGQPLAAGDLGRRAGRLPAETRARAVPVERAETLFGRPAAHWLVPGEPITTASVAEAPQPEPGQVAIAVGLKPELTPALAPGARVDVIALGGAGALAATGPNGPERRSLARGAIVQSVSYPAGGLASGPLGGAAAAAARTERAPGGVVLIVAADQAGPVLAAASAGGVALALLPEGVADVAATGGRR